MNFNMALICIVCIISVFISVASAIRHASSGYFYLHQYFWVLFKKRTSHSLFFSADNSFLCACSREPIKSSCTASACNGYTQVLTAGWRMLYYKWKINMKCAMCGSWHASQQQRFLLTSIVTVDGARGAPCALIPSDPKQMSRVSPNTAAYQFRILHWLRILVVRACHSLNLNHVEFAFSFSHFQWLDCAVRKLSTRLYCMYRNRLHESSIEWTKSCRFAHRILDGKWKITIEDSYENEMWIYT